MNVIHDIGMVGEPRNPNLMRLGAFARDVLAIVWTNSGITAATVGTMLGDLAQARYALCNLRRQGTLSVQPVMQGGRQLMRWIVADAAQAAALLQAPLREAVANEKPYTRCIANPDYTQLPAPMPALPEGMWPQPERAASAARAEPREKPVKRVEPRQSTGPAPRARQESPVFSCDANRHTPVVRAGSLDALRLRSLRWGTDRGAPEVRMAVVEAGSRP